MGRVIDAQADHRGTPPPPPKPFNDLYGYARGDEVLLCLAQCPSERIDSGSDFVGHIGGDDLLLVLGPED